MNLLLALESYLTANSELAPRTAKKLRHQVSSWERLAGSTDLPSDADFLRVRTQGRGKLSPATIEALISDVRTLCVHVKHAVDTGKPLRRTVRTKWVPTLDDFSRLYDASEDSVFPSKIKASDGRFQKLSQPVRKSWFQAFLMTELFTGLRFGDSLALSRDAVTPDRIDWSASKTSKQHIFPMPSILWRHLEPLLDLNRETFFAVGACQHLVRWEMARLCKLAGIRVITPQALRRLAVTTWSTVDSDCRAIVHGTGLGVCVHYVDAEQVLRKHMPRFPWPLNVLPEAERDIRVRLAGEIQRLSERMPADALSNLLKIGQALSAAG